MMFEIDGKWVDFTRMRIESRIESAPDPVERELAESLLHLYDQGEIEVTQNMWTGELMFRSAPVN